VVTAKGVIVQRYCVVCGVNCGYRNSRCCAMLLCCVWSLFCLPQLYSLCNGFVLCVEFIVVTATVDIVQWYCVVSGAYCGYSNSRYSAIIL